MDSLRNSGLNMMLEVPNFFLTEAVYPTGIVDFMTMVAFGLVFSTREITLSTAEQSKKFLLES